MSLTEMKTWSSISVLLYLNVVAAADLNRLRIDPGVVRRQQAGDHSPDIVSLADFTQRGLTGQHRFKFRTLIKCFACHIGADGARRDRICSDSARAELLGHVA